MKKFLLMICVIAFMVSMNINAQTTSFGVGSTLIFEPKQDFVSCYQYGLDLSVGGKFDNGLVLGGGCSINGYTCKISEKLYGVKFSASETEFLLPLYIEASYVKPKNIYADLKIGPAFECYESEWCTDFYLNITPIGYTFDNHSSIGLGYRLLSGDGVSRHGISVTYKYIF